VVPPGQQRAPVTIAAADTTFNTIAGITDAPDLPKLRDGLHYLHSPHSQLGRSGD
jgi:hypothetical protein